MGLTSNPIALVLGVGMGVVTGVVARMTWRALVRAEVSANWGLVRRERRPVAYWAYVGLHLVVLALAGRAAINLFLER